MKKHLLILLLACVASISASAYDFCVDGIYYDISGSEVSVTYKDSYFNSYSGSVTIPASVTYNNVTYSVTSIGRSSFWMCSGLTSVTIPNSVTSIGFYAFKDCSRLTSMTIPNSVTSINGSAFGSCCGLTSVTIGNSVTSIGNWAFEGCTSLSSVTIPESVTSISYGAFKDCSSLISVTLPNSVTSIENDAFVGTALYNNENNWENNVLYIGNHLIEAKRELSGAYTIKKGTITIADGAFGECSLTSVIIPNSVISIGDYAFYLCSSLSSVTIPNSVTSIREHAFYGTALYENASNWENNVLYICNHLIKANTDLSGAYTIKDGTVTIADTAFGECSLTSVTIPNSVTSIGGGAFWDCKGLTSVTIPNSVTSIGDWAFSGCAGLEAFYGKFVSSDNRCLIIDGALNSFAPAGITTYKILDSVTSIGDGAFENCSGLTSVTIPHSVTSIGDEAFEDCSGLTSVTVDNNNPANILLGYSVFYDVPTSTCILYVPKGSKELYAVADQWKDFENIEEFVVTGVEDVIVDNEFDSEAPYYDLMGRRVVNPTNGIYIKNGKKVLVK